MLVFCRHKDITFIHRYKSKSNINRLKAKIFFFSCLLPQPFSLHWMFLKHFARLQRFQFLCFTLLLIHIVFYGAVFCHLEYQRMILSVFLWVFIRFVCVLNLVELFFAHESIFILCICSIGLIEFSIFSMAPLCSLICLVPFFPSWILFARYTNTNTSEKNIQSRSNRRKISLHWYTATTDDLPEKAQNAK